MQKLIQGDCLKEMKSFESNSVDLVFTSPPYNMNLRIRNGKYCSRQIVKEISTKYKNFSDNLTIDEYFIFNKNVIKECLRVSDLVFYNIQMITGNKPALFKLIGFFSDKIKEVIIWDKINAEPAIGKGIMNSRFEFILVLQNSKPESRRFENSNFNRGTLQNLWSIKRGKKPKGAHGAVFPVELAEKIISNFSKEGQTVLDPFMGLCTTGIACKNLNRDFIGIELDLEYFETSKERIEACKN